MKCQDFVEFGVYRLCVTETFCIPSVSFLLEHSASYAGIGTAFASAISTGERPNSTLTRASISHNHIETAARMLNRKFVDADLGLGLVLARLALAEAIAFAVHLKDDREPIGTFSFAFTRKIQSRLIDLAKSGVASVVDRMK